MAAADVAGTIRARTLARRRIGTPACRRLAGHTELHSAVAELAATPYGRHVRPEQDLAEAEHAVSRTLLWHLRVLAGWQSRAATDQLRVLAAGFELANLDESNARAAGWSADPAFDLGALAGTASAGPSLSRYAWLHRVAMRVPAATAWAAGAALLLLVRDRMLGRPAPEDAVVHLRALTGADCLAAASLPALRSAATAQARWVLAGIDHEDDVWRAEIAWWRRVDRDGVALLHKPRFGGDAAVGCSAVLAVDAWRVRGALESAARGGGRTEVFDATT
ncbi:hypothetical protein [Paractinoplanes brasiliensis]|uniref:Uncharacterized protein n=1 Tax=Paractinoplanes brasiliensis TaxID=52695 RepID=A0A4R6JKH4_9ACTN|nr:hypothetical protein [Actinoplanes brasiliensis]TDO36734.1 hypothetical protein C8E87_0316 [Actinoplanes brasiliensis]GID32372.1 hypothetical protein Abr02nite_73550 [Actinoplanes brasiliensis]